MILCVFLNLLTVHCTFRNTGRYKNSNLLDIELLAIISQLEDRKKVCVENKPKFKKNGHTSLQFKFRLAS